MSRLSLLCFAFAATIGIITFGIKRKVATLESQLQVTLKATHQLEESMHILSAEWNYLNNPVRLQRLAEKHLHMVPGSAEHLVKLERKKQSPARQYDYDTQAMMRLAGQLEE